MSMMYFMAVENLNVIFEISDHRPVDQSELGPVLGLKKSSSLESLQAAVRDLEQG